MGIYVGTAQRIKPKPLYSDSASTTVNADTRDNFSLLATEDVSDQLRIIEVGWSAETNKPETNADALMATQLVRTTGGARPSNRELYIQRKDDLQLLHDALFTRFIELPDYLDGTRGSLLPIINWNASGGIVRWYADQQDEEIIVVGGSQVSC